MAGLAGCPSESTSGKGGSTTHITSMLAVGDTGSIWGAFPEIFEGQVAVGAAMQREHVRHPVDALVLLGDNFYPDGLVARELESRVEQNLVRPYCGFVEPTADFESTFRGICPAKIRSPPRLLAIVGNHDLLSPESVDLQRNALPRFIRNWDMPREDGPVVRELPGGLSLILLPTEGPWDAAPTAALTEALGRARGPWRVIIGHRPPITGHPQLSIMVAEASRASGRIVHAYLAGHVHGLVAIRRPEASTAPVLTVIAGSGSHPKLQEEPEYRIEGAEIMVEALGFVRVDAVADAKSPRLRVTLLQARPSAWLAALGTTTLARFEIDPEGAIVRSE